MTNANYNGWPNRQTWNIMLWLDNDEGAYRYYTEAAKRWVSKGKRIGGVAAKAIAISALGDETPDGISLRGSRVRWGSIAEAIRESVTE